MHNLELQTFTQNWDFKLLDSGNGYRLEQWGEVILTRPDPQIIWQPQLPQSEWDKAWAIFKSGNEESKGQWEIKRPVPNPWIVKFYHPHLSSPLKGEESEEIQFLLKLSPFKHTGLFAEQAGQWEWMIEKIETSKIKNQNEKPKILNLFAYTGGATMVLAKLGCQVTHVDASKPAITWANENAKLNHLPKDAIRWILDDCVKFTQRELKRGVKYDGIIMDPPAFGHSPTGKTWKFNQNLPELLETCVNLLSDHAQFLLINGYATNSSAIAINNLLEDAITDKGGKIEFGELCLQQKNSRIISTGIFSRWSKN
jgi:23S rRNA (cytosine1962-C5)-methyltransferase